MNLGALVESNCIPIRAYRSFMEPAGYYGDMTIPDALLISEISSNYFSYFGSIVLFNLGSFYCDICGCEITIFKIWLIHLLHIYIYGLMLLNSECS